MKIILKYDSKTIEEADFFPDKALGEEMCCFWFSFKRVGIRRNTLGSVLQLQTSALKLEEEALAG